MIIIRISQIQFDNLFSFKSKNQITDIFPISVFIGPNNAGKSNFIRVLKFYKDLLTDSLCSPTNQIKHINIKEKYHQHNENATGTIHVQYDFNCLELSKYPLKIDHYIEYDKEGYFKAERLFFTKDIENKNQSIKVFSKEKDSGYITVEQHPELINQFLFDTSSNITANSEEGTLITISLIKQMPFFWRDDSTNNGIKLFEEIKKFIDKWIFIPANRYVITKDIPEGSKILEDNGNNLISYLHEHVSGNMELYQNLFREIRNFAEIKDFKIKRTNNILTMFVEDGPELSVALDDFGSGFEQVLIFYFRIFEGFNDNKIFFIEEPEIHLHPLLQRKLLYLFFQLSRFSQFFITTHSTIFCRYQKDLIKPYLVRKHDSETLVKEIKDEQMEEIKTALGHVNSDLFGYNAVLFVEGDSEEEALPLLAKNLDIDIVNDGIRILNSRGYGNLQQIKNIIELLKDTGTQVYAIFDNHKKEQGDLIEIKKTLSKKEYLQLEKDFEYSFNEDILINTMRDFFPSYFISDGEIDELKKKLKHEDVSSFIQIKNFYAKRLCTNLDKAEFAMAIAKYIGKNPKHRGYSDSEKLLVNIHSNVEQKLNVFKLNSI